jgi:hypothetical protein
MIKKDGTVQNTKANLQEAFKCSECLHFKMTPHRSNKKVCYEEGIRGFAIAPKCYTPDYTKVISNTDEFMSIVTFFNSRTPQQRKIMLGMLRQQPKGKKLSMGTKVFLNLRNRAYVNNYVCGYVVGYTSGNEIVLAGSPERDKRGNVFFAYLKSDVSLLTPKEWRVKYKDLVTKGRITDPTIKGKKDITASVKEDTYDIPTIDNAPKGDRGEKKVSLRKTDLFEILSF